MKKNFLFYIIIFFLLLVGNRVLPAVLNEYVYFILISCGINIILGVSLNIINGMTGQFSIGHAGFMAIGAYVSASMSFYVFLPYAQSLLLQHVFFLISILVGASGAAFFGYIVGLPSLRLRGDYLGIVTLGFAEIIRVVILNMDVVGGARGFTSIPMWSNFFWVYLFVVVVVIVSFRLRDSYHGRALFSVREDEIAASAAGVNVTGYKVRAFVLSSFFAGAAGALYAHFYEFLHPGTFTFIKSFEAIIFVVLGGMGSISGSLVAATGLTVLLEALRPVQDFTKIDFRMVIYPLILIILMLTRPQGLFGNKEFSWRRKK